MTKFHTHYDELMVGRNASVAVIRAAYKALMQQYHPDKYKGTEQEANRITKLIRQSYEILINPSKRAEYDQWIDEQLFYQQVGHKTQEPQHPTNSKLFYAIGFAVGKILVWIFSQINNKWRGILIVSFVLVSLQIIREQSNYYKLFDTLAPIHYKQSLVQADSKHDKHIEYIKPNLSQIRVESAIDKSTDALVTSFDLWKTERSNNNQVSEKGEGARTPFQITPQTRTLAIKKWGIDPYLNPENAAEVAGRLLKDSLARNKGDVNEAIGEYYGGTDRKNWGPKTKAYQARIAVGMEDKQVERILADLEEQAAQNAEDPIKKEEPVKNTPQEDTLSKFLDERIANGHIKLPNQSTPDSFIHPKEEPGIIDNLKDSVTGNFNR